MLERYSRQIIFSSIGLEGQKRLLRGRVAIIGLGALGTVSADLLARAGVGFLRLVDRDYVDESNLQRQSLYTENDVARRLPKALAAVTRLREVNSTLTYEALVEDVNHTNIADIIRDIDLIIDAGDNLEIRYLINEIAVMNSIPWIYGACVASYGMTFTVIPGKGACLACIFGEFTAPAIETCDTAGVIGPIPTLIASLQAAEALKILSGNRDDLNLKVRYFDLWANMFHDLTVEAKNDCSVCKKMQFPLLEGRFRSRATYLCGRNMVQVSPVQRRKLDLDSITQRLSPMGKVINNGFLLHFTTGDYEMVIFPDGRALIKGTSDEAIARSLYARYLGG